MLTDREREIEDAYTCIYCVSSNLDCSANLFLAVPVPHVVTYYYDLYRPSYS